MTTEYTQVNAPAQPMVARAPETVFVFSSAGPSRPFRDIGLVEVDRGSTIHDTADMVRALRARAAAQGCDAVVIKSVASHTYRVGDTVASSKTMTASCVVYTDAPVARNQFSGAACARRRRGRSASARRNIRPAEWKICATGR